MITVEVINRFSGKVKKRYICKSLYVVKQLKRKYKYKSWLQVEITDWR